MWHEAAFSGRWSGTRQALVDRALEMVVVWPLCTAPGQVTDDGELTLCLARALAGTATFSVESVTLEDLAWLHSNSFNIGNVAKNADSKANGALMCATPLGAWGWRLSEENLVAAAMAEAVMRCDTENGRPRPVWLQTHSRSDSPRTGRCCILKGGAHGDRHRNP